jgi:hypothetical protein
MPNEFRVKRGLIVEGSGSNVVTVDGVSGRLFVVNDSFSGSLFSVNTVAGLPVIEAFSDNTVRIGQYGTNVLYVSQSRVGIGKEFGLTANLDVSGSVNITGSLSVNGNTIGTTRVFNRQTTNYTLALSDSGKILEMNSGSVNTVTVPPSSSVDFPTGSYVDIVQYGAGQTSFVTGSGVTIRSTNSWLKINARYGASTLIKIGGNEWYLFGNLNA